MELQLWRWSAAVQFTSLVMIAVFFTALSRSVRLSELKWWIYGWLANMLALGVTFVYWFFQPEGLPVPFIRGLYMGGKTAFVLLLLQGAWALRSPGARFLRVSHFGWFLAAYTLVAAFLVPSVAWVGVTQHVFMGVLFAVGGGRLVVKPVDRSLVWLASGFLLRSVLSFTEASAYGLQLLPAGLVAAQLQKLSATFLAAHSSFDSGTEWLIALGCVLALSERTQRELRQYNADLLAAQDDLRKLVDKDPLTKLANRRSLPEIFRAVERDGAVLLFFDLDDFKRVNDRHGHQVGDESLARFASALRESFRPGDALVRYAGDEFLVVARGFEASRIEGRVDYLRQRLRDTRGDGPELEFSVGIAALAPGGDPDEALRLADASMYASKSDQRARLSIVGD